MTPWDGGELRTALSRLAVLLRGVNTDHAALSWDAAAQYVIDGKCAMTVMGDWVEGYFKARGFRRARSSAGSRSRAPVAPS